MSEQTLHLEVCHSISEIGQESWDACRQTNPSAEGNPFLSYAFLSALEDSVASASKADGCRITWL
jgi:predicted N-acyltransferase